MVDQTPTPNPNIVKVADALKNASSLTKTPEQNNFLSGLWNSLVETIQNDPMYKAGNSSTHEITDKVSKLVAEDFEKYLNSGLTAITLVIAGLIRPLDLLTKTAAYENEALSFPAVRENLRPVPLDVNSLIILYRKFPEMETAIRKKLAQIGYADDSIDNLLNLSERLLNGGDLINLLSKSAFNEKYISDYGLDNGGEQIYSNIKKLVDKTGMPKEDFLLYWRAHWQDIPLNLLQIMRQKGKLSDTELTDILKAQNYPDYFIPKIADAMFSQANKLDIRRMYNENQIASLEDLILELEKIGYESPAAIHLANLYDELKNKPKTSKSHLVKLGESTVLQAYSEQMIDRPAAKQYLIDIGYDNDDIDFILLHEDFKLQYKLIQMKLETYKRAYLSGTFSDKDLIAALGHLNLPASYYDTIIDLWKLELSHKKIKNERPSKAEILSMMKLGIISQPEARAELGDMGLSQKYVDWYISSALHVKNVTGSSTHGTATT